MTNEQLEERISLLKELAELEDAAGAASSLTYEQLEDRIKLLKEVAELEEQASSWPFKGVLKKEKSQ
jgi:hypothetical protein